MLLLLRRAGRLAPNDPLDQTPLEERAKAQAIVATMAGLPLALDQAGAYIEETGCTLASYLEQYQHCHDTYHTPTIYLSHSEKPT